MLATLKSSDFTHHVGKICRLLCPGDYFVEVILDQVSERPQVRHQALAADSRTPFSIIFRTAPDCPWKSGTYDIAIPGEPEIRGVYVSRVLNTTGSPASLFQVLFN